MRVFIQNRYPEGILPPGEETARWIPEPVGDDGEFDQFYHAMKAKNWAHPIPTVPDPLCYTLKLRGISGAGLTMYMVGTYYGDESVLPTAYEYVEFKYQNWPSLPYGTTTVVTCNDDQHPALNFHEVFSELPISEYYKIEGYWLASDPDTYVSVAP